MRLRTPPPFIAFALACVLAPSPAWSHEHTVTAPATQETDLSRASAEMAEAANRLWAALLPEQRPVVRFELNDDERLNWHFVPKARKGLSYKNMTAAQRDLAHALLATGLSQQGFVKTVTIMSLDQVLAELEQGKGPTRDPDLYYFSVFGTPGPAETWGWRVEGHHVSLNFTIIEGKAIAAAPAFLGANPAEVRDGPRKGLRVLAAEEDLGRRLVKLLDDAQRKAAVIQADAPRDIVTGNSKKVEIGQPAGLAAKDMTPPQRELLMQLIGEYAHRLRPEVADWDLQRIERAGVDTIHFAWAGGLQPGQPHYYRIHGPTFLVEYDDTQNNANHIHTVWRDLDHDFGGDLLRKHYEQEHRAE